MNDEEKIADAKAYCDFILSLEVLGHGPVQVAEAIKDALDGKGLPEDCLAWMERKNKGVKEGIPDWFLDRQPRINYRRQP